VVRVYSISGTSAAKSGYGDLIASARIIDILEVRPGTQIIELGSCDNKLRFLFEAASPGHSRVAFEQAMRREHGQGGYGVLVRYDCSMPTMPETAETKLAETEPEETEPKAAAPSSEL